MQPPPPEQPHMLCSHMGCPSWDQFLALWVKVLRGWEERPSPTLPKEEITLLIRYSYRC